MSEGSITARIDGQRARRGFHSVEALLGLAAGGGVVLDPTSTLISTRARLGPGTVVYPGVVIEARGDGTIVIGARNVFYPGSFILVEAGELTIGDDNAFGPGGVTITLDTPGARLTIGDSGRYTQGAHLSGPSDLGAGSQVLGPIEVRDCHLDAGAGHQHPDPDARGGVLKGAGLARGLRVGRGEVISARTLFQQEHIERQLAHHPPRG